VGRAKRLLFLLILLILFVLLVEGGAFVVLSIVDGEPFSHRRVFAVRKAVARDREFALQATGEDRGTQAGPQLPYLRQEAIHPYLGYVLDPTLDYRADRKWEGRGVTRHGFVGEAGLFPPRDPDRIVVGILGGSVAFFFSMEGIERLTEELTAHPAFAGKELAFVRLCLGGYKQPQQLMTLNWFLAQGHHLDLVIEIDGFNDFVLAVVENLRQGVEPAYPRSWRWRVGDVPDVVRRRLIGEVVYLREKRRRLARAFDDRPFAYSVTWNLVWKVRDRLAESRAAAAERRLAQFEPPSGEYVESGPYVEPASEEQAIRDLVDLWWRCSRQMHRVCEAYGIRYFHFLQPNQYLRGSKPIGAAERARAIVERSASFDIIGTSYPLAIERGRELAAEGVQFHDLTRIFRDVQEPIYVDTCCHFNRLGNEIVAEAIARAILAAEG